MGAISILSGARGAGFELVRQVSEHPRALAGLAVMRVGYAIAALHIYLTNYSQRSDIWGPSSVYPAELYERTTGSPFARAYLLADSPFAFEVTFHLGIAAAVAMLLGVGGRFGVAAHFFFLFSLYQRNPLILDGGDNVAYICLLFLMVTNSTAYLTLRRRPKVRVARSSDAVRIVNIVHNTALVAIIFQLCVVYWVSAFNKIQGRLWQDGVAVYYIMRVPEFTWPGVSELIYENRWIVFTATWATVWFQAAFPPLILSQRFREPTLIVAALFHLGIAVFMNLWAFSIYMVATEAVLVKDKRYDFMRKRGRATADARTESNVFDTEIERERPMVMRRE